MCLDSFVNQGGRLGVEVMQPTVLGGDPEISGLVLAHLTHSITGQEPADLALDCRLIARSIEICPDPQAFLPVLAECIDTLVSERSFRPCPGLSGRIECEQTAVGPEQDLCRGFLEDGVDP